MTSISCWECICGLRRCSWLRSSSIDWNAYRYCQWDIVSIYFTVDIWHFSLITTQFNSCMSHVVVKIKSPRNLLSSDNIISETIKRIDHPSLLLCQLICDRPPCKSALTGCNIQLISFAATLTPSDPDLITMAAPEESLIPTYAELFPALAPASAAEAPQAFHVPLKLSTITEVTTPLSLWSDDVMMVMMKAVRSICLSSSFRCSPFLSRNSASVSSMKPCLETPMSETVCVLRLLPNLTPRLRCPWARTVLWAFASLASAMWCPRLRRFFCRSSRSR